MRFLFLSTLCLSLASRAHAEPPVPTKPLELNALLVSGGPEKDYNQYAIESNARFLEKITAGATARRVLFADGNKATPSIVTQQPAPDKDAQQVFGWIFDTNVPDDKTVYRPSTLGKIDGASTKESIVSNIGWLARQAESGQKSLLYFTGHGSPGEKKIVSATGTHKTEDYQNTTYALWGNGDISVHEVGDALKDWPAKTPLVLVMVQCHAGGFANLLFEGGDPAKPLLDRDFCGFFAATGDRMASGCTPEVDEADYQDFTTHFFAALSGMTRDGQKAKSADYDHNGTVSMLEAMSWTAQNDSSIDVPVCTSDTYLRTIFPQSGMAWTKTPYSQVLKSAAPWQKAILAGLSKTLHLTGENRIAVAMKKLTETRRNFGGESKAGANALDNSTTSAAFYRLEKELKTRFPGLKADTKSVRFKQAKPAALKFIAMQKKDLAVLSDALRVWYRASEVDDGETREAQELRFVRAARTLILEQQLQKSGTQGQKLAFAHIRAAESRNPLL